MDSSLLEIAANIKASEGVKRAIVLLRICRGNRFDGYRYVVDERRCRGLLGRLAEATGWSECNPMKRSPAERRRRRSVVRRGDRSCPTWGAVHGSKVHREVEYACRKIANLKTIDRKKYRKFDPCTLRTLSFLSSRRLVPVATEIPVGREGIATAVDLVAVDDVSGELVAIELKTGCEDEEYGPVRGDKPLPLGLVDCPRDKHDLQLAATIALMPVRPHRGMIVRPCSKEGGVRWRDVLWWKTREAEAEVERILFERL